MTVNVAMVGLGYWGPNLARNMASVSGASLHTLCDTRLDRLTHFSSYYPQAQKTTDYKEVLRNTEIQAVVLATPVETHFEMAKAALQMGKSVLVEKPLAQNSIQCKELISLAEKNQLILMVGHVFIYNAAVQKVKEYIKSGELGQIYYIYSQRLNLGQVRRDANALWNFAPHDLSILCYWLDAEPQQVIARGYSYLQQDIEDVVFVTLDFPDGVGANVHISWLDPQKVRRMTVVGSEKMVVYDDVNAEARIALYDKGFTKRPNAPSAPDPTLSLPRYYETYGEFQLLVHAGDILIPQLDFAEPLKLECQHFIECIYTGQQPRTDGYDGLRVVKTLEAAQHSLEQGGLKTPVV